MALPQLPQLTRDQIAKIFKDPTLIRAYDALQRALQNTPGDVEALTDTVDGLQALQYLLFALDPLAPNSRRLVAGTGVTFTDGGEGGDLAINAAGLSPIVDKTIASNISGAPAVPIGNTLSALFDSILGNTQGQIITRNAGTWTVLNPGTAGQALLTGGPGANVAWGAAGGSSKYIRGAGWAGGGIALVAPANDVAITCQATGVIQSVTLLGIGGVGSCVVDIWKSTYAAALPTAANSIVAAAFPTITAAVKSQDTTLTGWTTAVTAGDVLVFHLVSASVFTALQIILEIA